MVEEWIDRPRAVLQTFYAGMEGGTALAKLLFGLVSPSGKLPFTVARDAADYPDFDKNAAAIHYGYWHGYAKFEHEALEPRFAFGHGLSYSQFAYRALAVRQHASGFAITVAVRNQGQVAASEIVYAFIGYPGTVAPRARKTLKAFERINLYPGETRMVRMSLPFEAMRYRDPATHGWHLEHGAYRILVGGSSRDDALLTVGVEL